MKIVQVMESSATGTLSMVCLIANRFAQEGHDVHVIYSIREETPPELGALFDKRVNLQHIQMKDVPLLPALGRLRAALKDIEPDVVHLHSSVAGFLGRIAVLFSLRRSTVLYSPHCISFMRKDISSLKRAVFVALEWMATVRKCLYVACSESEGRAVRAYLRQPVVVVENAVGDMRPAEETPACTTASGSRCVVTVGGIRPQKNPQLFAQIARGVRAAGVRFIWIGDGDPALKDELTRAGVEVTGWLARDEVSRRLAQAHVYLSTSSWEGMPVSVIEAMLADLPVVVSACAGNVDIVRNAQTGSLFTTSGEAIDAINSLLADNGLRAAFASEARREAQERFCEARFFEQLTPFYQQNAADLRGAISAHRAPN
ncbi:glycosyltransferase [Paraburkholderia sp.]|uniref:glycosyltransferase n=1 Tax=Paraburkholderia sp. TaxID=1926495 RepID=UPI0023A6E2B2|nr:glycosyltransferase [Paraburkholderia sp.]MDE1180426.1 glycosyltransferase [Paraburkholderia sp.]